MKRFAIGSSIICLTLASLAIAADPPTPLFTVGKDTTILTEPLRDDGRPDYLAVINAQRGKDVTPENNGFALWLQIVGPDNNVLAASIKDQTLAIVKPNVSTLPPMLSFAASLQKNGASPIDADAMATKFTTICHRQWKRDDFPELAAYLDQYDQQLTLVTQAADRPHWYCPLLGKSMIATILPSLGPMREAARALMARAMLHAGDDFPAFLRDITAARKLARHIAGGSTIIEMLVGAAIEKESCETEGALVATGTLTAAQIDDLQKADRALAPLPPIWPLYDQLERYCMLDIAMLISLGHSADLAAMLGPQSRDPFGELDLASIDWDVVLKQINQLFDKEVAALKLGGNPALNHVDSDIEQLKVAVSNYGPSIQKTADETRLAFSQRVGDTICAVFCAALGRANMIEERSILESRMMTLLLAAAHYKADKGNWPTSPEDLVPLYIPSLPTDPFSRDADNAPLHYLTGDAGITIYSVGFNGTDDGGVTDPKLKTDDIVLGITIPSR